MKLFKLPEHKVFGYKPLYYDPVKDRLAQRRKALGLDTDVKDVPGTGGLLTILTILLRIKAEDDCF